MSDEEDDSMAANPEPPRVETGYAARKRREQYGEWVMRWEPRAPEPPQPKPTEMFCKQCKEKTSTLHSIHPEIRRLWCGKCQGQANRARMEGRNWP